MVSTGLSSHLLLHTPELSGVTLKIINKTKIQSDNLDKHSKMTDNGTTTKLWGGNIQGKLDVPPVKQGLNSNGDHNLHTKGP